MEGDGPGKLTTGSVDNFVFLTENPHGIAVTLVAYSGRQNMDQLRLLLRHLNKVRVAFRYTSVNLPKRNFGERRK